MQRRNYYDHLFLKNPLHLSPKLYNMNFGDAIIAAKTGHKVARSGWNGQGMYAYIVPAGSYPAVTEIARKEFGTMVPYREYWALKTAQGDIATWAPSGSDSLAGDWEIVKDKDYDKTECVTNTHCEQSLGTPTQVVDLSKVSFAALPYIGEILSAIRTVNV